MMSERIEVEWNLPEWNYTDMTIFNTQPTCGEISCDQCNERYEKAMERIKAMEDVVRELVKALDGTYFTCSSDIDCEFCDDMAGLRRRSLELLNGGK